MSKDIHVRIDDELSNLIDQFKAENKIQSTNEAVGRILNDSLKSNTNEVLRRLDEIETRINEGAKASYGCLNILSFIYRDFCALIVNKFHLNDKRFEYWKKKSLKDIFMFFRSAGNGNIALQKFNFWKSYDFACKQPCVRDGNSEELLGISPEEYNKWVSGVNDSNAMRAKKRG